VLEQGSALATGADRGDHPSHMAEALVLAVGIAASPLPILAIILILSGVCAWPKALAFSAAWAGGLALVAVPLGARAAPPGRAPTALAAVRGFVERHDRAVTFALGLGIALVFARSGAQRL
jgi:hypothetical protein